MENLLTSVISSTLFITSAFATPMATQDVAFTRVLSDKDYVGYVVHKENSLATISHEVYGSEAYWTVLWNDNSWIVDPESVQTDMVLKVRAQKPQYTLELDEALEARNQAIIAQKNQEYLKKIGYGSTDVSLPIQVVAPTIAPIQAPATPAPVASGISDEAITYLGNCEAGMDPAKNTGNGYYGAFQFSQSTWNNMNTGYARADLAPIEVQKEAVKQLLSRSSIHNQFPGCAKKMKSAGLI